MITEQHIHSDAQMEVCLCHLSVSGMGRWYRRGDYRYGNIVVTHVARRGGAIEDWASRKVVRPAEQIADSLALDSGSDRLTVSEVQPYSPVPVVAPPAFGGYSANGHSPAARIAASESDGFAPAWGCSAGGRVAGSFAFCYEGCAC